MRILTTTIVFFMTLLGVVAYVRGEEMPADPQCQFIVSHEGRAACSKWAQSHDRLVEQSPWTRSHELTQRRSRWTGDRQGQRKWHKREQHNGDE